MVALYDPSWNHETDSFGIKRALGHQSMQFSKITPYRENCFLYAIEVSHYNTIFTQGDSGTYLGSILIAMVPKKKKEKKNLQNLE